MISCLSEQQFARLIDPLLAEEESQGSEISIREVALKILQCAQNFVPSEAGSIMLASPSRDGELVFVASFGIGSQQLVGQVLPADTGIAGRVFRSGQAVLTNTPAVQPSFYGEIDELTANETLSLLVVPVKIFSKPIGVLSLVNAKSSKFQDADLALLAIFSEYLTHSLALMMEARRERKAALLDNLTGLYNDRFIHRYLHQSIEAAVASKTDIGLIFLDLDHFKEVVDAYGHLVGSQALSEIGRIIGAIVKKFAGIASRYGGDEYLIILPGSDRKRLEELAERLRSSIEQAVLSCPGEPGREPIVLKQLVTASIGAITMHHLKSEASDPTELRQILIREADKAMYTAKALGKNRVHWATDKVEKLPALKKRRSNCPTH